MVDLLECDDYEDFTKYTGGTFFSVVHPDDRDPMKKEFHRQLARTDNPEHIDFLSFRMVTKKAISSKWMMRPESSGILSMETFTMYTFTPDRTG